MKATELEPILNSATMTSDDKARAIIQLMPGQKTIDRMWPVLIWAVALIAGVLVLAIIWVIIDGKSSTSPDILVGLFTTSLAGLLGLFVNPSSGSRGN